MSAAQQGSQQPTAWTEPPWSGWIETTGDALLILEAARRGLIPRVTRRLVDAERRMITSGSVFVFDEDESGIKRWTDGLFWSPSRILGNFLLYRETDKRGNRSARVDPEDSPDVMKPDGTLSRPKNDHTSMGIDKQRERTLLGSLTNSYKFKPDGLMKKTFSLTIGGVAQHLISYYKIEDVENGRLRSPSSLPELAALAISAEYLDKTHFRNPPKVEIGADGILRYCGEGDELDPSPSTSSPNTPNSHPPTIPLLTDGHVSEAAKRPKRFLPYGPNRTRKKSNKSPTDGHEPIVSASTAPTPPGETPGAIVLSPPPAPPPIPPLPNVSPQNPPDNPPPSTTPSSYPPQYSYFPQTHAHSPVVYPPHLGTAGYSQPGYPPLPPPPPPPQSVPGAMSPQPAMSQYGYPGTYRTVGMPPQSQPHGQSAPVQDTPRPSPAVPSALPPPAQAHAPPPPPPLPYYSYHYPQPPSYPYVPHHPHTHSAPHAGGWAYPPPPHVPGYPPHLAHHMPMAGNAPPQHQGSGSPVGNQVTSLEQK